jgi:monofunctional biosynthetic peptidoglycan transglycosylase
MYTGLSLLLITPIGFPWKFYSGPGQWWFNDYGARKIRADNQFSLSYTLPHRRLVPWDRQYCHWPVKARGRGLYHAASGRTRTIWQHLIRSGDEIAELEERKLARFKQQRGIKRIIGWAWRFLFKILFLFCLLTIVEVVLVRFLDPPFTVRMAWSWLHSKLTTEDYEKPVYRWRQLEEISPHLRRAVLAGEDQRFLSHHGFDFTELQQAGRDFLLAERIRGASTITMQAARTVFLWPARTWWRKIAEAYYTVLLELIVNKQRILEIYLNTVHWGKGIMGAEAASQIYFSTSAYSLSPSRAALLAAILPNPTEWSPVSPSAYVRERQKWILKAMPRMPLL